MSAETLALLCVIPFLFPFLGVQPKGSYFSQSSANPEQRFHGARQDPQGQSKLQFRSSQRPMVNVFSELVASEE